MKLVGSVLAALAVANPISNQGRTKRNAAAATSDSAMDTDIIMINMNMANIQVRFIFDKF